MTNRRLSDFNNSPTNVRDVRNFLLFVFIIIILVFIIFGFLISQNKVLRDLETSLIENNRTNQIAIEKSDALFEQGTKRDRKLLEIEARIRSFIQEYHDKDKKKNDSNPALVNERERER